MYGVSVSQKQSATIVPESVTSLTLDGSEFGSPQLPLLLPGSSSHLVPSLVSDRSISHKRSCTPTLACTIAHEVYPQVAKLRVGKAADKIDSNPGQGLSSGCAL